MEQRATKRAMRRSAGAKSATTKIVGSRARAPRLFIAVLIGTAVIAAAVRAYNHATPDRVAVKRPSMSLPLFQNVSQQRGRYFSRLSHQPEAERLRRSLGQRFLTSGRERAILIGTLTVGADQSPVRIVRTQSDDGERVEIAIGAGTSSLVWTPKDGALVDARRALGDIRATIERLALDSPDEFVLAQLRGASYYTIARTVMPKSAEGSDAYSGPTWDVVRVGEPEGAGPDATLSKARTNWARRFQPGLTGTRMVRQLWD